MGGPESQSSRDQKNSGKTNDFLGKHTWIFILFFTNYHFLTIFTNILRYSQNFVKKSIKNLTLFEKGIYNLFFFFGKKGKNLGKPKKAPQKFLLPYAYVSRYMTILSDSFFDPPLLKQVTLKSSSSSPSGWNSISRRHASR